MVPRSRFQVSRFAFAFAVLTAATVHAQAPRSSPPPPPLPQTFFSGETPIRVVPVARGLSHPWSLAFLPNGEMLVTERDGRRETDLIAAHLDDLQRTFPRSRLLPIVPGGFIYSNAHFF